MTVATLITALQRMSNPHRPVVVHGPVRETWDYGRRRYVDLPFDYVAEHDR